MALASESFHYFGVGFPTIGPPMFLELRAWVIQAPKADIAELKDDFSEKGHAVPLLRKNIP